MDTSSGDTPNDTVKSSSNGKSNGTATMLRDGMTTHDLYSHAEDSVERAKQELALHSKQERFDKKSQDEMFADLTAMLRLTEIQEPRYGIEYSQVRDKWLRNFVRLEPHLNGVLKATIDIDKNRGLIFVGPERQVNTYRRILVVEADDGKGWRSYNERSSAAFRTADLGSPTETGRTLYATRRHPAGPLEAVYNVDPVQCRISPNRTTPLVYRGNDWSRDHFFNVVSMPSTDESQFGLGYCFVSRCIELAKLMYAVFAHDQEMVGARMPRGLLLLKGITTQMFQDAMKTRKVEQAAEGWRYFSSVAILAANNPMVQDIDAKLIALSQLPTNFDREKFISHTLYGYALLAGYDAAEFWPVQFGALGRGTETALQHRKGTGKGGLDYILLHQEALQRELPKTLFFSYEQRDAEGEQIDADLAILHMRLAVMAYEAGLKEGQPLLDRDEARALLVIKQVVPRDWTQKVEDVTASDKEQVRNTKSLRRIREEYMENMWVQRAIRAYPAEPIVRYTYPRNTWQVLWERGDMALEKNAWQGVDL